MLGYILKKIMGTQNERMLRPLRPIVEEINALEPAVSKLSDAELRAKTDEFKAKIAGSPSLAQAVPSLTEFPVEAATKAATVQLGQRISEPIRIAAHHRSP